MEMRKRATEHRKGWRDLSLGISLLRRSLVRSGIFFSDQSQMKRAKLTRRRYYRNKIDSAAMHEPLYSLTHELAVCPKKVERPRSDIDLDYKAIRRIRGMKVINEQGPHCIDCIIRVRFFLFGLCTIRAFSLKWSFDL